MKKLRYLFFISLFLLFCSEPAWCLDLSEAELEEIKTILNESNSLIDSSILSPQDLQNIDDKVTLYISNLEKILSSLNTSLESEKKLSEDYAKKLEELKILSANLRKEISDLKKSSLVNNLLWLGGGILAGGVLGYFIFK